jgi:hypothetical protein
MNRWREGEDRGSKETDGCPLIAWVWCLSCISAEDLNTCEKYIKTAET